MKKSLTRFLLLSFCALLGCTSAYKSLKSIPVDTTCANKIVSTRIATSWYGASIDVTGKHLSGLVLIKNMPDSSQRVVFSSEAGVTFFDFGFNRSGEFKVYSILKQLNRKPVINTLRKDFELILGIPFRSNNLTAWSTNEEIYFGVKQKKETAYFIVDKDCISLRRLELGSKRKKKVSVRIVGAGYPLPDTLDIRHYIFPLHIQLAHFKKE